MYLAMSIIWHLLLERPAILVSLYLTEGCNFLELFFISLGNFNSKSYIFNYVQAALDQLKLMGPVILSGVLRSLDGSSSLEAGFALWSLSFCYIITFVSRKDGTSTWTASSSQKKAELPPAKRLGVI